ncbi:organic hydroperoxide reductase OsmC/OhrA [Herbihabitans rhizosphaerae]|uniref:Organic hydroperoxide reductase OsmC/OhrA n=1 Tax=Herbihabitans rhizosphaerae TaxID=1872711 RepID=A0A4Q7KTA1_9PSEU|nr:OsmC family protein [Herbihabitans rhizosphaerae]RZS39031.1 organic hydroperoxide reductase OsmC/OhrA [Herbihabitans rhizosphaerae]
MADRTDGDKPRTHDYSLLVRWTGNQGSGTSSYRAFSRAHEVGAPGVTTIPGSADPAFRGDPARWNPEQLFVAALAQCHMLWYLHLAATSGLIVTGYEDAAIGTMVEAPDGGGEFSSVTLRPTVTIAPGGDEALAHELHERANALCFIARSVKTPVHHEVTIVRTPA